MGWIVRLDIGYIVMDWIHLALDMDRIFGCCNEGKEPCSTIKCGEFLDDPIGQLAFQGGLRVVE
jgi:hypothetical protein